MYMSHAREHKHIHIHAHTELNEAKEKELKESKCPADVKTNNQAEQSET